MISRISWTVFRRHTAHRTPLLLIAALLIFISYLAYQSSIYGEVPESPAHRAFMKRVVGMARYTGGDAKKLTEEDRVFLATQTGGHTEEVLRNLYEFSKHTTEY